MRRLVVFEVRTNSRVLWAWCATDGHPGFTDVACTLDDGWTPAELPEPLQLGRCLFSVPASRDPAERHSTRDDDGRSRAPEDP